MAPHPSVESPLSIANTTRETTFDIYDVDNKIPIYCMFKDIQVATRQWAYMFHSRVTYKTKENAI